MTWWTLNIGKKNWPAESHESIDGSMTDPALEHSTIIIIIEISIFSVVHAFVFKWTIPTTTTKSSKGKQHTRDKRSDAAIIDSNVTRKFKYFFCHVLLESLRLRAQDRVCRSYHLKYMYSVYKFIIQTPPEITTVGLAQARPNYFLDIKSVFENVAEKPVLCT